MCIFGYVLKFLHSKNDTLGTSQLNVFRAWTTWLFLDIKFSTPIVTIEIGNIKYFKVTIIKTNNTINIPMILSCTINDMNSVTTTIRKSCITTSIYSITWRTTFSIYSKLLLKFLTYTLLLLLVVGTIFFLRGIGS